MSLITKGEKGRCRHHPTGRGCRKSGEISSEKVKPSSLIPAEGHHHEGMNGGGRDARRIQIAVKFLNVNAATEIKPRDEEAGRKSGLEGDYGRALKGFSPARRRTVSALSLLCRHSDRDQKT